MGKAIFPRAIIGSRADAHHHTLAIGCGCPVSLRIWFAYHDADHFDDIVNECLICGATGTVFDLQWGKDTASP